MQKINERNKRNWHEMKQKYNLAIKELQEKGETGDVPAPSSLLE
jgi:hypothetical protein